VPRRYTFFLDAGQYLHLIVDQVNVDVVVTLRDPAGHLSLQVDNPNGLQDPEELFLVAEAAGRHSLEVSAWDGSGEGGHFEIRPGVLRAAAGEDRKRARAAAAFSRARLLKSGKGAVAGYREAAGLWRELRDHAWEARALDRLGRLYLEDPTRYPESPEILRRARALYRRAGKTPEETVALFYLSQAWSKMEDWERAAEGHEQALPILERLGDRYGWAARANDLAMLRVRQERVHGALDLYSRAVEVWRELNRRRELATTFLNLGALYESLGESRLALHHYQSALQLAQESPDPHLRAVLLTKLGDVLLDLEGPEVALEKYREALKLRRLRHDVRGEAVTLNSIGRAQLKADRPREALQAFRQAEEIFRRQGGGRDQAMVLNALGFVYERLGYPGRAREQFGRALEAAPEDRHVREIARFGLARVARAEGRLTEAQRSVEESLEIVESIRQQVWSPDLRWSYHALKQERYAFLISLLAERHRREPGRGHDSAAFAVSERARAQSLLDLLSTLDNSPGPEELRRLDDLGRRINARHLQVGDVASRGILDSELTGLLADFRQAKGAADDGTARPAPPVLSLAEVQGSFLDEDTLLLAYFLGEERSFLWAVTSSAARFVSDLPGRATIEAAARKVHARMTESHHETGEAAARHAAARLSQMILAPVADLLGRRRLVVVASGALQIVPFAALPVPGGEEAQDGGEPRPLMLEHEIGNLPSVSVLAALRSKLAGRRPPRGFLAVVSDPVTEAGDERLREVSTDRGKPGLRRLPYTGREAEAILALAGSRPVLAASGFEANRDLVRSGKLSDYRILHFATHGLFNDLYPELSALALSSFDPSGRPIDGHLRAYEVSDLELEADLVVLSACRTAQVSGEGMVGLTQGFLHAGAPRLVVSLWEVNDRATGELMKRFYAALLIDGLSPAQALRKAQISLWSEPRWRAPYYWAGFAVQGEWN
jgi:CHAT domain-containing protein/tetratricopeptide (TPR) repeat protein